MSKDTYRYIVNIEDFEGYGGEKGLQVTVDSDYELSESELGNKAMTLMMKEYDKLAHEYNDQNALKKMMNVDGLKNFEELENRIVAVQHEVTFTCCSHEL